MNGHERHDLRSLAMHQEAVRVLKERPEQAARALEVLTRWQAQGDLHSMPLGDEWRRIIEGRLWGVALEESDRGQQLRQASPLSFVLTEEQRSDILRRFRRDASP